MAGRARRAERVDLCDVRGRRDVVEEPDAVAGHVRMLLEYRADGVGREDVGAVSAEDAAGHGDHRERRWGDDVERAGDGGGVRVGRGGVPARGWGIGAERVWREIHAAGDGLDGAGREGGGEAKIPMCGVPYHSAEGYINRLIEKGYKVAICEQVEDPAAAKGVVRREIVRIVTPGTVMESKSLEGKSNNFIASVAAAGGMLGIAACDLSTGELYVTSFLDTLEGLTDELNVYMPSEVVGDAALLIDPGLQFPQP